MSKRRERVFKFDASTNEAARGINLALFALACALYVAARVWRLDAACLWFDEIFGVHAAAWHGWGGMWRFVALDLIHPPLFYAVLKVWAGAFGVGSVWWLRLLPVVVSVVWIAPFVWLARELGLRARVLNLALLLAAVSGTLIKYAQELRMYSLLLCFATCSLWLFARLCNADTRDNVRRAALALFAANVLLVYTHYFGWLIVALEALFVASFVRARLRVFAASVVALAACFAPWAWAVWNATAAAGGGLEQNLGWAARPHLRELFVPYLALNEPLRAQQQSNEPAVLVADALLTLLIFAPPLVALCWRVFARSRRAQSDKADSTDTISSRNEADSRNETNSRATAHSRAASERLALAFLLFFSFAPVVMAFALAQVLPQSVWGVRHLLVVAPAYLLLVALAVDRVRAQWLAILLKVSLGCWLALASVVALTRRAPAPVWCAWDALALAAARDDATMNTHADTDEHDATKTRDDANTRDDMKTSDDVKARGAETIYAFEDLIAYQLWHALRAAGEKGLRVAVVRGVPDIGDDRAFFLPRGFDEVSVETLDAAMREDEFWIALRGAEWDGDAPLVKLLRGRGYDVKPRYEFDADGQKAFIALARRRTESMK
jgi:hypothetical protein